MSEVGRCTGVGQKSDTGAIDKKFSDGIKDLIRVSYRWSSKECFRIDPVKGLYPLG